MLEGDFAGTPEEFVSPHEALKHAMQSLKQNQWQSSVSALIKLAHISRVQPELLDASMPRIYRTLCRSFEQFPPYLFRHHTLSLATVQPRIIFAACCEIRGRTSLELSAR